MVANPRRKLHPCSNVSHMAAPRSIDRSGSLRGDAALTLRITRPLASKLKAEAKRRRMSVGALVRIYIEGGLVRAGNPTGTSLKARRLKRLKAS